MYDNTVKTDSDTMDFHLLQISLSVPTLETTDRLRFRPLPVCLHDRDGCLVDRTAIVMMSWLHNHAGHQPFLRCGCWWHQLILSLKTRHWHQFTFARCDSVDFYVVVSLVLLPSPTLLLPGSGGRWSWTKVTGSPSVLWPVNSCG